MITFSSNPIIFATADQNKVISNNSYILVWKDFKV